MKIEVGGIVQGVGFRPFIHRLVTQYGFRGWVRNNSHGVDMELEGEEADLLAFAERVRAEAPPLAEVEFVRAERMEAPAGFTDFEIVESRPLESMETLISPDIGLCADCLREMSDPRDRRYRYPFLNCTNCGPRFTILKTVPYDRSRTSMSVFPMCPDCEREYHDISNRRYHAEPTCCPVCGPQVFFRGGGETLYGDAGIEAARRLLKAGGIVCVKGLGGMHLACLPERAAELRRRKQRDERPFALMCRNAACAEALCSVSGAEKAALTGFRRPIVLMRKRERGLWPEVSENGYLGVMLPYTPLHVLLLGDDLDALIMTSANLSDRPILYENETALTELAGIADGFLLHDRDIQTRCDDSLLWIADGREYPARRSRGYVPAPVRVAALTERILACGAEQKASFSLSKPGCAFPSQHIGDLKNYETFENYRRQIAHFCRLFGCRPQKIACDLHPDYLSTRHAEELAEELDVPLVRVQHHHAHMAACMADNGLERPVIGVVWDGVGYGPDGTGWGGEFLTGDYRSFRRRGHLRPLPLPGGDVAVREIWRLGYAVSRDAALYRAYDTRSVAGMLARGVNCPLSSGMGRLFDAACSLIGIRDVVTYEGQGAVLLEAAAAEGCEESYGADADENNVFDWEPLVRSLVQDRRDGAPRPLMAARFLNTLVDMASLLVRRIGAETGLRDVVLSGGTFQNMYLLSRLPARLRADGFQVWTHSRVSCNDEGLSLGQLLVAQYAPEGR